MSPPIIGKQMCERCEGVMVPYAGYQMGGQNDWMAFACKACQIARKVFGRYVERR